MAEKESFRQRQENELEVIQSIFGSDVVNLRQPNDGWKPLNLIISLVPQMGSSGCSEAYARTKLHIICSPKYPKIAPKISLEDSKGLSDIQIVELTKELIKTANSLKGEVMIFDLIDVVRAFLRKHNKPPPGSFYDQMLLEKLKKNEDLMQMQQQKLNLEQQTIREEVLKRKEILRIETAKARRDTRRSISESSPTHRTSASSENSENSIACRSHIYPNECTEHRNSETLYFSNVGRRIVKGCCLGHSQKGCVTFSGIDQETGQLLYVTEWNIKYSQFESKCIPNCQKIDEKCNGHSVDEILQSIDKQMSHLNQLRHKNLITYECLLTMKKKDYVVIYIVQDFVLGTSVSSISGSLGWCTEGASMIAKGVLEALIYLHNKGVSHSNLYDCTVFMDNSGTIRVTDFALVPYLLELSGGQKTYQGDLPALGSLIESLIPTPQSEMRDFIEKCKSERTLSASELSDHPFLRSVSLGFQPRSNVKKSLVGSERSLTQMPIHVSMISERSRLNTEFEMLSWLGQGAFGDVCKVRNKLDNREYAIKRIPLTSRSRQLFKKMTREIELLSRLNHENVVRYYNSWIENANAADLKNKDSLASGDWSKTHESAKQQQVARVIPEESCSSDWMGISPNVADDSSSDGIEFVNSDGEIIEIDEENEIDFSEKQSTDDRNFKSPRPEIQIMCIQMEFCDKSTLRTAIDADLYINDERVWRLFREIAEGLSHIHQQGMIHRDLKPVNIFLDARDQVKIGDFGLATTNFLALQSQEQHITQNQTDLGCSLTGKVGTALYVAPELTGNASRSTYNQKVDLYSLGIIFFEMCSPKFETAMERVKTIASLRSPAIVIPEYLDTPKNSQHIQILKWLLHHDQMKRPTAEELLSSELVPPAQLEANELQEMLRHALANPQSKAYKHLVARCLAQQSDTVEELTYHLGLVPISPTLELVKSKIISLFRKHGAVEVVTPLLSPYVKNGHTNSNAVRLMTHSGSVIILPHDLRVPFVKHVALNGINMLRRYSVGRVYREKKVFNFHPKQLYECAFDIITPNPGNLLADSELLSIAYEITNEIPALKQKNITFRINHTGLLRAILLNFQVPPDKYHIIFTSVLDHIDGKTSKFQLLSSATAVMQSSKYSASQLVDLLLTDFPLGGPKGSVNGSSLRTLIRGRGEAAALAKGAIREMESVVQLAQGMGVNVNKNIVTNGKTFVLGSANPRIEANIQNGRRDYCPIIVFAGLPIGYERAKSGGIVWQMLGDLKRGKKEGPNVLAVGGRYDSMLTEIRKQAQMNGSIMVNKEIKISGAGCSFALDKIISALHTIQRDECRSIDVVICATGSRPPLKDVTQILRSLWSAGIRSGVVEASTPDEAQDLAKDLGAVHVILFGEDGALRVRSWARDRFQEKQLNREELTEYIKRWLRSDQGSVADVIPINQTSNLSIKNNFLSGPILPVVEVVILTQEKQTANMRRRYENQLKQHMATSLVVFGKKEIVSAIVIDLPFPILKALTGAIDPRDMSSKETRDEINFVIERFPKHKRYIHEIVDEIKDILAEKRKPLILGLYSIADFTYRILL